MATLATDAGAGALAAPHGMRLLLPYIAAAGALAAASAFGAEPYDLSGSVVYTHCTSYDVACEDFTVTMDAAIAAMVRAGFARAPACPPRGETLLQEILIFQRFAETHPEYLNRSAAELFLASEAEAFPCAQER